MQDHRTRGRDAADRDLLTSAAEAAGVIAMRHYRRSPEVWTKEGGSPVSEADLAVDRYLRDHLTAERPDYGWLSEETADDPARLERRRTFVVDPIDGTRAFLEGDDRWCVALAVVEEGRPVAGVIAVPAVGRVYAGARGEGATRDGVRIEARGGRGLAGPTRWFDAPALKRFASRRVPYVPALAHRIAMVADAQLEGAFARPRAHDWDLAAADLLLHEAGGFLADEEGEPPRYNRSVTRHGLIVASGSDSEAGFHEAVVAAAGEIDPSYAGGEAVHG